MADRLRNSAYNLEIVAGVGFKDFAEGSGGSQPHFQNGRWRHIGGREERPGPQRPVTHILRRNNEVLSQDSNGGKKRES